MAKRPRRDPGREMPATREVWSSAQKWVTGILGMLAALMAVLVNAKNLGLSQWAGFLTLSVADHAAHRIVLQPRVDTLHAIGEPAVILATVADAHGAALSGARLRWRSGDTTVATVDSTGMIVARAPGRATIEARVRDVTGVAVVLVRPVPEHVRIAGDSARRIADGDSLRLEARVLDARGHAVRGVAPRWSTADTTIATVDSLGRLRTRSTGRTLVLAAVGELRDTLPVEVALVPAAIEVAGGQAQRTLVGRVLPAPLVLQVRSRSGRPVPAVRVELRTEDGDGQLAPASALTDADGRVRATWTLGATAGMQRAFAQVAEVDSVLVLEAEADPVAANTRVALLDSALAGTVGDLAAAPVRVRVTDSTGTALAQVRVGWSALDGGRIEGVERTDTLGVAEARWTLGPRAGTQRLLVQVGNPRFLPAVTVRARAAAGRPAALALRGGDRQRATAGRALGKAIEVEVRDSLGNVVEGARVLARATAGVLSDTIVSTDARGLATVQWTLGPRAGEQRVKLALAADDRRAVTAVAIAAPTAAVPAATARTPAKAPPAAPTRPATKGRRP